MDKGQLWFKHTGTLNQTVGYSYNNDFRVSSINYAGTTQNLGYDNDGPLTTSGAFTITRNTQNGLPEAVGDGTFSLNRTFSGYGEIDGYGYKINNNDIYTISITRDKAGRIIHRIEDMGVSTTTWDYAYDGLGRLTEAKKDGTVAESYAYDADGNRIAETNTFKNITGMPYTYSIEDHLITAGTDTYQFDKDGFLTGKTTATGTTIYKYSSRGELLEVTKPDGTIISYDHDPSGRRIAKRINGQIAEKYLWSGRIRLMAVYDGNDQLIMRFNYADARVPVSMEMNGVKYYLVYDQVGSLRAVVDNVGDIIKQIDYDSFGNVILDTEPSLNIPIGFAGGLYDSDTGLVRFGARDYDPAIGRWTAKDPIDFAGGDLNLFGYVGNGPVNWVDPLGLWYVDVNVSIGYGGGATGGIVISPEGISPYVGGGAMTPPGGVAVTWSPSDPTPGWNVGLQGGYWGGGQVGYSFGEGGNWFGEVGFVTPGGSFTGYYVFEPWKWPRNKDKDKCK